MGKAQRVKAKKEAADIQGMIREEGGDFELAPWYWSYYAEKVRKQQYDLDEGETKLYFELNTVLERGVFYTAEQLYGLALKRRTDLPVYHPDVLTFDVFDHTGEPLAIYCLDPYARPSKRGGAWMTFLRSSITAAQAKTSRLQRTEPCEACGGEADADEHG